jgi:hypothetical protein
MFIIDIFGLLFLGFLMLIFFPIVLLILKLLGSAFALFGGIIGFIIILGIAFFLLPIFFALLFIAFFVIAGIFILKKIFN